MKNARYTYMHMYVITTYIYVITYICMLLLTFICMYARTLPTDIVCIHSFINALNNKSRFNNHPKLTQRFPNMHKLNFSYLFTIFG